MDKVLALVHDCAAAYTDDILVFSPSWEPYLTHLARFFSPAETGVLKLLYWQQNCMGHPRQG